LRVQIPAKAKFGIGNLPKKFRPDPSTFYLVIVVSNIQTDKQTDRQTDKPTPVKT